MGIAAQLLPVLPTEHSRALTLALLLFINSLILESNEVVATSGFVSRVGPEQILWVWAVALLAGMISSGAYSLVVDRTRRERLATAVFLGFAVLYVALYGLFRLGAPDSVSYPLLTMVNEQQWLLLPMLMWALAGDLFSVAESKRLFPLLGMAAFAGGIAGNLVTASLAQRLSQSPAGSVVLLLMNAAWLLLMAAILTLSSRRIKIATRQAAKNDKPLEILREGLAFVREVPSYRYLTLAMLLLGASLNVIEYQLIATMAQVHAGGASLEAFYATLRAARIVLMLLVQGLAAGWLLKRFGFKSVFFLMPLALLGGLLLAWLWPTLIGVVLGEYLSRITLQGIDEPSRRSFVGLVPDERRGRVSAFIDGYPYQLGSILSCGMVLAVLAAVRRNVLTPQMGRTVYTALALACAATALWALTRFRAHYDASMFNWRLRRRQRKSLLDNIEF